MKPLPTRIIYIYGPPAVGKTTVAAALSKRIGYPVLHPHLFSPIAGALMQGDMRTNRQFRKLMTSLRMECLRAAIRAKAAGIILTGVYVYKTKKNRFIEMMRRLPATIHFVQLTASERSLMRRVGSKSRRAFDRHKITTKEMLIERMTNENVTRPVRGVRSLKISTDDLKPQEAALVISRKLKLRI